MKFDLTPFRILAFLMTVLMSSMPFITFAQQNLVQVEATVAAEQDAQSDVNGALWFLGGCLGGGCYVVPGLLFTIYASHHKPSLPAQRGPNLMGKSAEYVAFYTAAYSAKAKRIQTNKARTGCITGTGVLVGLAVVGSMIPSGSSGPGFFW